MSVDLEEKKSPQSSLDVTGCCDDCDGGVTEGKGVTLLLPGGGGNKPLGPKPIPPVEMGLVE